MKLLFLVGTLQFATVIPFIIRHHRKHVSASVNPEIFIKTPSPISDKGLFLDLEDIIDDDVDFLIQLRKQVESPLKASPKEVTNRIRSFFAGTRRTQKEIEVFRSYLEANKHVFDIVNSILIIEGSERMNLKVNDFIPQSFVYDGMNRPSPLLTSSMAFRGIKCLRNMSPEDETTKKFLKSLWDRVSESGLLLNAGDVCSSIYNIQNYNTKLPEIRKLIQLFARSLAASEESMPSKIVSSALYGMRKMRSNVPEVRSLMAEMAKKINASEAFYHSVNVCIALNGLQLMDDTAPEVRAVLSALMDKAIPAHEQGLDRAGDREISMALFGLQRMGDHRGGPSKDFGGGDGRENRDASVYKSAMKASPELRRVVLYVSSLVKHHDAPFESKRLGFALCGLGSMSHEMPELQTLVAALAEKTKSCWGDMNGHELSMCLHGLMGLQSDSKAVRELVSGLVPLVRNCPGMGSKDLVSALAGLQGMRSSSREVCQLVGAVAELLERSNVVLKDAADCGTVLYGLQGISSGVAESRKLLALLPRMIGSATPTDDARAIATLVGGLKCFNSRHDETLAVVKAVVPQVTAFSGTLQTSQVALALYGMQELRSGSVEVAELVVALTPLVASARGVFNPKGLSMAVNGIQGLDAALPEVKALVGALTVLTERSVSSLRSFEDFHQLSAALGGLAGMSGAEEECRAFVQVLARLVGEGTGRGSWTPGQGQGQSQGQGQGAVKTERVALALYGLQGFSWEEPAVRHIMSVLVSSVKRMTAPDGKALGMMLQGFASCSGTPPKEAASLLTELSLKMRGWSRRSGSGSGSSTGPTGQTEKSVDGGRVSKPGIAIEPAERQVSLRSCLGGVSKLDKSHEAVQAVLRNLAQEVIGWDGNLDEKTKKYIREAYQVAELQSMPEVEAMLQRIDKLPVLKEQKPKKPAQVSTIATEVKSAPSVAAAAPAAHPRQHSGRAGKVSISTDVSGQAREVGADVDGALRTAARRVVDEQVRKLTRDVWTSTLYSKSLTSEEEAAGPGTSSGTGAGAGTKGVTKEVVEVAVANATLPL